MAREKIPEHTERAATFCRSAKPEEKQYELIDSKIPGLQLRVNPSGKKAWALRYSVGSGENLVKNRMPLGLFPEVSVTEARKAAQQVKSDVARGADPVGERKAEAEQKVEEAKAKALEEASRVTVNDLFERWMRSDEPMGHKDQGKELLRRFNKDVLPLIGNKEINSITQADILCVTDNILSRGVNRMAQAIFSDMKQMFTFAVVRLLIKENPAANLTKENIGKTAKPRDRVLSPREIRQLDQALHASSLNRVTHLIYMLQISMTCRINELCQAEWSEFDWSKRAWTIPGKRTKSGRSITVNLSAYSIGLFEELRALTGHTAFCYPGQDETKPINRKAATNHARDRQLPASKERASGRTIQTQSLAVGGERWKTHDLRRSGSTLMQQLGIPTEVSERCLNHAEGKKTKITYHHYNYEKEMKRAWYLLSETLSVITGPDGEAFLKEIEKDRWREPDEEIGMLGLVKKFYKKPDERSYPA
ncbi:tyrosine-type recombinase/integrase [Pseudomonas sp. UL073]|uniref:Tyrosine-type recombinase/integrase n=1 Tax=Zestomonas insulae TaxID=2809017 RepID=A0ABS2IBW0_9GAMM|nr:site-specific integrase [Pseudomonas insulae]MBM7059330.1 tyrosine-type recombinase/integrase [Pseudomonas insulae]